MEPCAVCQEEMDVPTYIPGTTEITSEGICTRLQCGHALHTSCMIRGLQTTYGKCVVCNQTNINTENIPYSEFLAFRGACITHLNSVKRLPGVQVKQTMFREKHNSLKKLSTEFRKRITSFKTELRNEMNLDVLIKETNRARSAVTATVKKEIRKKGSMYVGALSSLGTYHIDRSIFGRNIWKYRSLIKNTFY